MEPFGGLSLSSPECCLFPGEPAGLQAGPAHWQAMPSVLAHAEQQACFLHWADIEAGGSLGRRQLARLPYTRGSFPTAAWKCTVLPS